ncbi:LuxR C-terminal-related transcriptional regulator [Actinoplanes sp. NPDC048796]|uniref:helix-turn-helix transcriptional regulator n=1 Tax=unclassified Actinoplanes TaxID=2626549 RepID=UPI0034117301
MPVDTGAIPALTRWGLSADADLVYRALAVLGPADRHRLSRELGLARARTASALDELVAAGATTAAGNSWAARAPGEVVRRLSHRPPAPPSAAERWRHHFATVDGIAAAGPFEVPSRLWPNRAVTRDRVAKLAGLERHEHLAVNNEPVISAESLSAAQPVERRLAARGVRLRVIGPPPPSPDGGTGPAPLGPYRQIAAPPLKLLVFDRRVALFPADPLNLERGYVEVTDARFVTALCDLFERLWGQGRDPFRQEMIPIELSPRESALVGLLAMGHTDQTAAEELGLSPRTVAYALRALMDRLGVQNRFQLALVLGAAGAVRPYDENGPK